MEQWVCSPSKYKESNSTLVESLTPTTSSTVEEPIKSFLFAGINDAESGFICKCAKVGWTIYS